MRHAEDDPPPVFRNSSQEQRPRFNDGISRVESRIDILGVNSKYMGGYFNREVSEGVMMLVDALFHFRLYLEQFDYFFEVCE
jgi:hypothetical protein